MNAVMKWSAGLWIAGLLCCLAAPIRADDAPTDLAEAMKGETTPELVKWVQAADEKAQAVAARLAGAPAELAAVCAVVAGNAPRIAERDGDAASPFADWLVEAARAAYGKNAKDPAACEALSTAWLAKARVGVAAEKNVPAKCWIDAGALLVERASLAPEDAKLAEAYTQALAFLHEGASQKGAMVQRLFDSASVLGPKALEALPEDEDLRRAVAASFVTQARAMREVSKRRTQAALRGYFDAFGPLVRTDRYDAADARAFNELVTLGRADKLNLKEAYVSRPGTVLRGLLAFELPETGRWTKGADEIDQQFDNKAFYRSVSFGTYEWSRVYGQKDNVRDCGGDNVKGVATLTYLAKLERFRKIRKNRKPGRGRLTKRLPSGISFTIEGKTKSGLDLRMHAFFVKAVKAEKTISILILESANLRKVDDPEKTAVYESFDITKKKR